MHTNNNREQEQQQQHNLEYDRAQNDNQLMGKKRLRNLTETNHKYCTAS